MSHESEHELFVRSLAGNWQARVDLYKKLFYASSRVRRLGEQYASADDFLHDCFTTFLRAAHIFHRAEKFSDRAEAVAVWTALERERLKKPGGFDDRNVVRMCAATEGVEAASRERIDSYVPPRVAEDSLRSRIAGIIGELPCSLLYALEQENATVEDSAAAAGKPVQAMGPLFVRAVDRLSRFFGAPPALNADLEQVFAEVSAKEAAAEHADPLEPRGRVISMQLDPTFYIASPELRKLGLSVPAEVRTVTLWEAAAASAPHGEALSAHLARCRYCSEVLRSLQSMRQALRCGEDADFRVCPGAATLLRDSEESTEAVDRHVEECELCRDERSRANSREDAVTARGARTGERKPRRKIVGVAIAAMLICGMLIFVIRHFSALKESAVAVPNDRYASLGVGLPFDDNKLLASVLPKNRKELVNLLKTVRNGDHSMGKALAERFAEQTGDPAALTLYAECLYGENAFDAGYREMLKAEAIPPRNSFRCWSALQCALMAGDKATAEREIGHLSSDPDYGAQAKTILAQLKAR